jgi:hypothetical protein
MRRTFMCSFVALLATVSLAEARSNNDGNSSGNSAKAKPKPNILFIIMDDVGIDQMTAFGYGGPTAASTPNINAVAQAGLRFRNAWAMPECSPSRAIFFEGRYPLRTNIFGAILSDDLANSQMSPYEVTTPKILKQAGYQSAMFGKFHLAGPDNNPFGKGTPHELGWDYFDGFLVGAPAPIDTTIGGQYDTGTYTCGFVPSAAFGGADFGACYQPDNSCANLVKDAQHPAPGFSCVQAGGLFVSKKACTNAEPALNFSTLNGYYLWSRTINQPDGTVTTNSYQRGYVTDINNQSAIDWINMKNQAGSPWMATVSYANIHTPYQQPPPALVSPSDPDISGLKCTGNNPSNEAATRIISNQMLEAMDTEIGRLLVNTGLATFNPDGSLNYQPEKTNTTVVIIGDNGTYAPGVKAPFDPGRAKGFVYQTGVWVPLIVAGPQVVSPNRNVNAMVNIADLFQFWGDLAGLDVRKIVPKSHILDSVSMLPYITNPNQPEIRQTNFTQTGNNIHSSTPSPCVIPLTSPATCVQIFNVVGVCNYEGGDWYGSGAPVQYKSCCEMTNAYPTTPALQTLYPSGITILPDYQSATRDDSYKIVQLTEPNCSSPNAPDTVATEFYKINENEPLPRIDRAGQNLCTGDCPAGLTGQDLDNFNSLLAIHLGTLNSEPACPGDGNEDKKVNGQDVKDWEVFASPAWGLSSWYDFNLDGFTNGEDLLIIQRYKGTNCLAKGPKSVFDEN